LISESWAKSPDRVLLRSQRSLTFSIFFSPSCSVESVRIESSFDLRSISFFKSNCSILTLFTQNITNEQKTDTRTLLYQFESKKSSKLNSIRKRGFPQKDFCSKHPIINTRLIVPGWIRKLIFPFQRVRIESF
jgi:hypothetical protein